MRRFFIGVLIAAALLPAADHDTLQFREHLIASDLKGGYHVASVDMNGDGRPDLLALASGIPELLWFENPTWERHVIGDGFSRMINAAAADVTGDGIPEIVVADLFENEPAKSVGRVWLLESGGKSEGKWEAREIDRLTTSHRIRTANIDGKTKPPVFINAPLAAAGAKSPEYDGTVPVVYYRPGEWKRELLAFDLHGVVHGIYVIDWNGDGADDLLAASFDGLTLFESQPGKEFKKSRISMGNPQPAPKGGSSDVAAGTVRDQRVLAAIEPWHGNEVVVYRKQGKVWSRHVIDDEFPDGHSILTADFNGDGTDEIVTAFRKGQRLAVYRTQDGAEWTRQILDESTTPAGCAASDLNGDGRIDLACISSTTANLKWYENQTPQSR